MDIVIDQKPVLVMKFGGTSVRDKDHIRRAAEKVIREKERGYHVIVVVSAMAGVTDRLVKKAIAKGLHETDPEYSEIVSQGELETSQLLSKILNEMGHGAQSWSGPRIPIQCDSNYGRSKILDIPRDNIDHSLREGEIAVVAGFQGISQENKITTLGRSGSDTTAVALASFFKAKRCDIYTDVDGVYTADPRVVENAQRIEVLNTSRMLELAEMGSKVLHPDSVRFIGDSKVLVQVLSSQADEVGSDLKGTLIGNDLNQNGSGAFTGVSSMNGVAALTFKEVAHAPGTIGKILSAVDEEGVSIDMMSHPIPTGGTTDFSFSLLQTDIDRAMHGLAQAGFENAVKKTNLSKISVIGAGMRSNSGVAATFFKALGEAGVNVELVTTSDISISVLVQEGQSQDGGRALHSAFGLDRR